MEDVGSHATRVRLGALPALAAALLFAGTSAPAFAQYFGRNKVQYESFDFSVLSADHFLIYHYPQNAPAVLDASRMLASWYDRHEKVLGFGIRGQQKVILYDSLVDFLQTNSVPGGISQAEGGVTESVGDRIVVPLTGDAACDFHVLGHELVHAFQFQRLASPIASPFGGQSLPLWFMEGMAEYLSRGETSDLTDMWMRDAVLAKDIPDIGALTADPDRYFPYRFGETLWDYIQRTAGEDGVRAFFDEVANKGLARGTRSALGYGVTELSKRWKDDLMRRYGPQLDGRTLPSDIGRTLESGGRLNLSPAISPDGRIIAVFSNRDLFTLELDLLDSSSGTLMRRLASSDTDAHFDALRFLDSAGAWSPDSRAVAFAVFQEGDDAIAIVDTRTGAFSRIVPFETIDGISNLSWSPDGTRIVMSATSNAVRDLYLLDLKDGSLTQLTSGWNAEIQPVWSPDGASIAFATDAGERTDRESQEFDSMNLAVMDLASRQTTIISLRDGAKHVNPQFSPDGRSLFFVAAVDGYSDIYRYRLDEKRFYRLTRLATGVSGPTALSPCLSVARDTGDLVFTVFTKRGYQLHALSATQSEGTPVDAPEAILSLPLAEVLAFGAPAPASAPASAQPSQAHPYRPAFQLVSISQANVGLSFSPYGATFGAAAELAFEDVLGDHFLDTAAQFGGGVDTLGAEVIYANRRRRMNWGAGLAHIPQQSLFLLPAAEITMPGADTAVVTQTVFDDQAEVLLQYPLGTVRRLESDIGYELVWSQSSGSVTYYRAGLPIGQGFIPVTPPPPLSLFHGSLALVADDSFFGLTDPVRGYRFRVEAGQTLGSLAFLTALADARAYLFLRPITFAFRAVHLGRYLTDAESPALNPFFLGYPDLVRGYEPFTYSAAECAALAPGGACPLLSRLSGSRIALFNAELRVPLFGTEQLGLIRFPALPTTLALFLDAGVAWSSGQAFPLDAAVGAPSGPVASAGAAIRFNLFGVFVLQLFYAWPFQRPPGSGYLGFLIAEGW